jgi:DNA (cytosine-5)-methyltransferase 1
MKHLGLFEGIGGFSLAARWMGWETVAWVEIDKFCQQVLKKNFPEAKGYGDIKEFDGTQYRGAVDIITGGFPCQPFSSAGKRKGKEDDRYLWPQMLRVIREVQPAYIVGENVYGLVNWSKGLVFEQVCADLENEGYQVQPVILPACAVDAPHRRDRIWFVAYSQGNDDRRAERELHQANGRQVGELLSTLNSAGKGLCGEGVTTNAERNRSQGRSKTGNENGKGNEIKARCAVSGIPFDNWQNFPTQPPLRNGNDGLPSNMVRSAIQAGGNSIVPQVAYEIFKAIESLKQ